MWVRIDVRAVVALRDARAAAELAGLQTASFDVQVQRCTGTRAEPHNLFNREQPLQSRRHCGGLSPPYYDRQFAAFDEVISSCDDPPTSLDARDRLTGTFASRTYFLVGHLGA